MNVLFTDQITLNLNATTIPPGSYEIIIYKQASDYFNQKNNLSTSQRNDYFCIS